MLETYGFNDSALNLFCVVPPSADLETYKNTLRILRRGFRSRTTRSSARLLKGHYELQPSSSYSNLMQRHTKIISQNKEKSSRQEKQSGSCFTGYGAEV